MVPLEGGNILPPSRDRQAFPEFYAEHDAAFAREVENQVRIADDSGSSPSAAEIEAEGNAVVLHRPARVRQRGAPARHRALQERARRRRGRPTRSCPSSRRRASTGSTTSTTRREEEFVFAVADALHEEYKAHRRRGLPAPGRRRGADARVRLDPLARRLGRRLPPLGGAPGRGAQPRARGDPRGPRPLPRLLRQLARPARLRPAARAR